MKGAEAGAAFDGEREDRCERCDYVGSSPPSATGTVLSKSGEQRLDIQMLVRGS